jgi:hypothetical protein
MIYLRFELTGFSFALTDFFFAFAGAFFTLAFGSASTAETSPAGTFPKCFS